MSRSFDRVAEQYDASRGGERRGGEFAADIRPRLVPGTVLEIAVGTGVVAQALRAHGFTVFGVDLSGSMLAHALTRLGPVVARADALRLPFGAAAVDNAVFAMALHAIVDVKGALAEAARVTRPGGRIVATHDRPRYSSPEGDVLAAMEPLAPIRDTRPDTEEVVAAAADALGLELVDLDWGVRGRFEESPNVFADGLERRLYSYLWDLDEASFAALVRPVIDALRALPEPDRRRPVESMTRICAYRVP